jgi:hypothetical protein
VAADLAAHGWRLERALTDNGSVERVQRTILEECWRPSFAQSLVPKLTGLVREASSLSGWIAAVLPYDGSNQRSESRVERVKAVANFGFADAIRPWLELRGMLRWAQGNSEGEIRGQSVVSPNEQARQRITLQVRAFQVEQEPGPNIEASLDRVVDALRSFPDLSLLPTLATLRFDLQFIDPYGLPFHELVARIKEVLLAPIDLAVAATDIQVVLDEAIDGGATNHHQIGPMTPDQLNTQLLAYRRTDLPAQFLFVGLGRTITNPGAFSLDVIADLGAEFSEWAGGRAESIAALVRR